VLGSQNWTDDAFRLNLEDSVALSGRAVDILAQEFLRLWRLGRGLPADATG
jgi:phosphatidylserine/phosphatidylglycerophosphate/cardiolipin synthase-like enzyme